MHCMWCDTSFMPVIHSGDIDINYEVTGSGPRVLFFNGSGATLAGSRPLIDAIAKVCTVAAHDQRGLGLTSKPEGPYTMAQYAADGAALLDHLGWDTCAVMGISFGGMVAQEFAVTYPQRVERLLLLCTSAGGAAGSSYPLHELGNLSPQERAAQQILLTDSRFTPEFLADPAHEVAAMIVKGIQERSTVEKDADTIRGERLQLEARIGHDVADRLHVVDAPTFVTCGRYDGIAPVSNSVEIAKRLTDATVSVYEGGHMFSGQDRQAILDMREFLTTGARPMSNL